jgi:anti-sigma regulatory factor (Ser/Thr protein kinase)
MNALLYELPATTASVDRVCREVDRWLKEIGLEAESFAMAMLLHDSLNNAVLHGGSGRRVRCAVGRVRTWLQIEVEDDGPGFDWRARLDCRAAPDECHGRGLQIYQMYSDDVRFNRRGNRVRLRRRIRGGDAHVDCRD